MIEFSLQLANKPGQLAHLARQLGEAQVNVKSLAAITSGPDGFVKLVVDRDDDARRVLREAGIEYEEHRVITASLHDKPGALADFAEALATNGVNIEGIYLISSADDQLHFALAVDDASVAHGMAG